MDVDDEKKPDGESLSEDGPNSEATENDACLEKNGAEKTSRMKEKIKEKCACLELSWNGLKLLIGLGLLCFLLLVVTIVLASSLDCWGWSRKSICQEPKCLRIGADVLERLNQSARECHDFFAFSCGQWTAREAFGEAVAYHGKFSAATENERQFRDVIRRRLTTAPYIRNISSIKWKLKAFYDSCMNEDAVEALQMTPLERLIRALNGWKLLAHATPMWNFDTALLELQLRYGVNPFFEVYVDVDNFIPDKTVIKLKPSGLTLPYRELYFRHRHDKIVKTFLTTLRDIANLFGASGRSVKAFEDSIYYFEKRIAEVSPHNRYNKHQLYQRPITLERLQVAAPRIRWVDHLRQFFPKLDINEQTLVVTNLTYLMQISQIISSSDSGSLNNYMMWQLVHKYASYLSSDARETIDELRHQATGSYRSKARWEFCTEEALKIMPVAMNSMYAETEIPVQAYGNVSLMFNELIHIISKRIGYVKWMDDKTKQFTQERAKSFRIDTSPPPFVNSSEVGHLYSKLIIQKSDFFQNIINGVALRYQNYESWLQNASRFYWFKKFGTRAQTPFLHPQHKIMVIPVSLLTRPWFNLSQPFSMNFGGLGVLMARTLINALEDGREYDRMWRIVPNVYHEINGWRYEERREDKDPEHKISHWWTNYTLERYERHQNCVATEFFKLNLPNVEVDHYGHRLNVWINGNRTVRENIADMGGIAAAYHAFINWEWNHGRDKFLPGLQNRTQNQMFFIGYAQTQCSIERPASILADLHFSDFSPNKIRVNGALSQLQEFIWTFGCAYRDFMNSRYKCETW